MKRDTTKKYIAFAGIIISYITVTGVLLLLTRYKIIGLPFSRIRELSDAWFAVVKLLPVPAIALSVTLWLVYAKIPVWKTFVWRRFSLYFLTGLIVSAGYAVHILIFKKHALEGWPFWIPLFILCTINALSEEMIFRHVMLNLFENVINRYSVSNILQSLFYAIPHLIYGSYIFALCAFLWISDGNCEKKEQ